MKINLMDEVNRNQELINLCKDLAKRRFMGPKSIVTLVVKLLELVAHYQLILFALMGGEHGKSDHNET